MTDQHQRWPFPPNWANRVTESHEYRTEIIESRSGKEQRRALRMRPRQAFEFDCLIARDALPELVRYTQHQHHQTTLAAHPLQFVRLVVGVEAGVSILQVDATKSWIVAGDMLVLSDKYYEVTEIVEVESIVGTTINLVDPLQQNWRVNSKIHACFKGRILDRIRTTHNTNTVARARIRIQNEPDPSTPITADGDGGSGEGGGGQYTIDDLDLTGWELWCNYTTPGINDGALYAGMILGRVSSCGFPWGIGTPDIPLMQDTVVSESGYDWFQVVNIYNQIMGQGGFPEGFHYMAVLQTWRRPHDGTFEPGTFPLPGAGGGGGSGGGVRGVYESTDVLLKPPNWLEPISVEYESNLEEIDFGFGIPSYSTPVDFRTRYFKAGYAGLTAADANNLIEFFRRQKGQRGEFYMPTWLAELKPIILLEVGSTTLTVNDTAFIDFLGDPVNKNVAFRHSDKTWSFRKVTGVSNTSTSTTFALDTPLTKGGVVFVSWMPRWRFAADRLDVDWLSDQVAQMSMPLKSLEDIP